MPPFAGYTDLADYLHQSCARRATPAQPYTLNHLQADLDWRNNYIYAVLAGKFKASRARLTQIAEHFKDDPYILFILTGLESLPPKVEDRDLRELLALAKPLPAAKRRDLVRYARYLRDT